MPDFPAADGSNIRVVEREQCNDAAIGGYKLDLESRTIFVEMYHCAYVALCQTVLGDVMCKDDRV